MMHYFFMHCVLGSDQMMFLMQMCNHCSAPSLCNRHATSLPVVLWSSQILYSTLLFFLFNYKHKNERETSNSVCIGVGHVLVMGWGCPGAVRCSLGGKGHYCQPAVECHACPLIIIFFNLENTKNMQ